MKKGQWGLVRSNDPTCVWTPKPMVDLLMGVSEADFDQILAAKTAEVDAFEAAAKEFSAAFKSSDLASAHHLYEGGLKAGYNRDIHGFFENWLFDYLAKWLLANPTPTFRNRMPKGDVGERLAPEIQ